MDKWLKNLKTAANPVSRPASVHHNTDLNVPSEFRDLFKASDAHDVAFGAVITTKVLEDGSSEILDAGSAIIAKVTSDEVWKGASSVDDLDAHVGSQFSKRESRESFPEKRSSGPGKIRFELKEVNGEHSRYGYNHLGEIESVRFIEEVA